MCKFKRCLVSIIALGMSVVMFSGCGLTRKSEDDSAPVFRPDPNVEDYVEETTVDRYVPEVPSTKKLEEKLNKGGYSLDPEKRLGKDSNGNYVEKKCVNPYCGCADCKCNPCECDDR